MWDIIIGKINISRPPDPPNNLTIFSGDNKINLTWNHPIFNGGAEITEYRVYRRTQDTIFSIISIINKSQNIFIDLNLINGKQYFYKVSAINIAGESFSSVINGTPILKPYPPENVIATSSDNMIKIEWTIPINWSVAFIQKINLFKGTSNDLFEKKGTLSPDSSFFIDQNVTNGRVYFYYLTCENLFGESPKSDHS